VEKRGLEKVKRFDEYEETGDEYIPPESYEEPFMKVVKHGIS